MRMAGEAFGIGKYITELTDELLKRNPLDLQYVLIFDKNFSKDAYDKYVKIYKDCVLLDAKYYSWAEQIKLPYHLSKLKLDLVHFPNFNVPIFGIPRFVLTIHDLIHHQYPGKKKKNFFHRLAYRAAINMACRHAVRIIAVSNTTKNDIIKTFQINPEKIAVIEEGVTDKFKLLVSLEKNDLELIKLGITKPYILFVGVWRKYKNLPLLSEVFTELNQAEYKNLQLVLIGEEDKNYPEIKQSVLKNKQGQNIIATGRIPEELLIKLYNRALCYVSPSLSEGFGLTSLEAQACGTPVISSDIPVAREILKSSAVFFNPYDRRSLKKTIARMISDPEHRQKMILSGLENSKKYKWSQTALQTEKLYKEILSI